MAGTTSSGLGGALSGLLAGTNPWLAGLSFAAPFLTGLFGKKENRQYRDFYRQYSDPSYIFNRTNDYLPLMRQAMQGRLGGLGANTMQFQNTLNRNLARTGLRNTGLGGMSASLSAGMYAGEVGDAYGQAYQNAISAAYKDREHLGTLLQTNQPQDYFSSSFGGGLNNLMQTIMYQQMYGKKPDTPKGPGN
jgi:hypothetical protein